MNVTSTDHIHLQNTSVARSQAAAGFADTHWSQVYEAGGSAINHEVTARAREKLCRTYWPALYGYLRQSGYSQHDAEDLVQQFFVRFLGNNSLANADRSKGRFRNFLLGDLKYFLSDETRKISTKKRGGKISFVQADHCKVEATYLEVSDRSLTPDQVYDQRWVNALLTGAWRRLRAESKNANQLDRFKLLERFLSTKAERC